MKLDSKYFDRIRVKPGEDRLRRRQKPSCEWPGCAQAGDYRAPKGRDHEGEYHSFCLGHVREYNKQYNYFAGMSDTDLSSWRERDHTGHRPTWRLGENSWATFNGGRSRQATGPGYRDPHRLFAEDAAEPARERRAVRNAELKALHALGLDETATPDQVKRQYKTLVKRLHPDANGGSRATEDKLREIINAYDYLRNAGFC
ncbi:MAG: J domain-containing protein [Parvibaculaceae bacterium]